MDPRSVVKWVNDGLLPAYRTPGGHRRIRASDLLAFLQRHGMFVRPELQTGKVRVLLVDDDPQVLAALKRAMKAYRYEVELLTAQGRVEALVRIRAEHPQVQVLDVHMPDLDGLAVLAKPKANPETKDIEVVVVSGTPTVELEKKALKVGAKAFRSKPFAASSLVELALGCVVHPAA
jgi:excisionase family DNA binding protein